MNPSRLTFALRPSIFRVIFPGQSRIRAQLQYDKAFLREQKINDAPPGSLERHSMDWQTAIDLIDDSQKFILSTHVSADGDGLGSEMALYHFLRDRGKTVQILNPSGVSREFRFLDPGQIIQSFRPVKHFHIVREADIFIVVDIGDFSRLKAVGESIQQSRGKILCIDHHPQIDFDFDCSLIDPDAAAAGMIVYDLIQRMDPDAMKFEIAQALYCALMTDTGSFRFSNTTPYAHQMAKELMEYGVKPYEVYRNVYESYSVERMRLLGKIIENLRFSKDRRIAYFPVTQKMQREVGATAEDIEGFSDFIRSIGDIEVAVMFHEMAPKQTRVNFRSKGRVVINQVAKKFNGGGHEFAAGGMVYKPYEQAMEEVIAEVKEAIKDYRNSNSVHEVKRALT